MVTEKQLIANRENSKKGGPKTATGKAAVRYNPLKHGLLSQQVVLPDEDEDVFAELSDSLMASLHPQRALEKMQVDIIVSSYWRLSRAVRLDTCYLERIMGTKDCLGSIEHYANPGHCSSQCGKLLQSPLRYETSLERKLYNALNELERLQMARKGEMPRAPVVIDVDVSHQGQNGLSQ